MPPPPPLTIQAIQRRIHALNAGPYHDRAFISQTYGIAQTHLPALLPALVQWGTRTARHPAMTSSRISRFAFEDFLSANNLLSPKQAAYKIGVTPTTLRAIVRAVTDTFGIPPQSIGQADVALHKEFIETLHTLFPALTNAVFSNHSAYCRALHKAFSNEGVRIEPAPDPAAALLGGNDLAAELDIVTGGPTGLRYSVWLDFGKPMWQEPDKTSTYTFAVFRDDLQRHVPEHFRIDEQAVAAVRNALHL